MAEEISPLEDHGWWMERLRKDAKATRHKALFLADVIKADPASKTHHDEAAAELRCLHAVNQELLKALKQALEECIWPNERLSDVHAKARAAIAKAEGEQR
jgi:hypothetical protein